MINPKQNAKRALSLLFIMFAFASSPAQQSVYIDPTNKNDPSENGTLDHPYDSWNDVRFVNGWRYLQKCGTIDTIRAIEYNAENLTFGSYGSGAKPKIYCDTTSLIAAIPAMCLRIWRPVFIHAARPHVRFFITFFIR